MKLTELVTNEDRKLSLQKKAREDAERDEFKFPHDASGTYQRRAMLEAENMVYLDAHHTRKLRLERMA